MVTAKPGHLRTPATSRLFLGYYATIVTMSEVSLSFEHFYEDSTELRRSIRYPIETSVSPLADSRMPRLWGNEVKWDGELGVLMASLPPTMDCLVCVLW